MSSVTVANRSTIALPRSFTPRVPSAEALSLPIDPVIEVRDFNFYYGQTHALKNVSLVVPRRHITALIGPSGCGKSTLLRSMNRLNDLIDNTRHMGTILLDGESIFDPSVDVPGLRSTVGMVFQKPNPFPMSIFENVAYGLRIRGERNKERIRPIVEHSLQRAGLWEEVSNDLEKSGLALSGGQQQRLCIARAIATEPEVLLLDEPTSALDPTATQKVEELLLELKNSLTIVIVTHSMQQAARISDFTAFFYEGKILEQGHTHQIFMTPSHPQTEGYVTGRFG